MCQQIVESILCRKCHSNTTGSHFSTKRCVSSFLAWSQPCVPRVVHKNIAGLHRCEACKRRTWLRRTSSQFGNKVDRIVHPRGSGNLYGPDLQSLHLSRQY